MPDAAKAASDAAKASYLLAVALDQDGRNRPPRDSAAHRVADMGHGRNDGDEAGMSGASAQGRLEVRQQAADLAAAAARQDGHQARPGSDAMRRAEARAVARRGASLHDGMADDRCRRRPSRSK